MTLPLWSPSTVEIGSVGYLRKPEGKFVTLFNAFDPPQTSDGVLMGMANLHGYGKIEQGSYRQDKRNRAQRGLDVLQSWLSSKLDSFVSPPAEIRRISQFDLETISTDDIHSVSRRTTRSHLSVSSRRYTVTSRNYLPLRSGSRPMLMKS